MKRSPMFSSESFIVLTHVWIIDQLELIFVYDVSKYSVKSFAGEYTNYSTPLKKNKTVLS